MANRLHFGDHGAFHRQVLRMTLAGAALGLLGFLLAKISGHAMFSQRGLFTPDGLFAADTNAVQVVWMMLIVATLGLVARPPAKTTALTAGLLAAGLGLVGALVHRALVASPPVYPWFGVGLWGMAVGVLAGRDLRDYRRFSLPLATGLTVLLATWVQLTYMAQLLSIEYVPSFVAAPLQGALFGFLAGIGLVARQIHFEHDRVAQEFAAVKEQLSGEMLDLAQRSLETYRRINEVLRDRKDRGTPPDPKLISAVDDLVLRILDLGRKWHEVEKEASRTSAGALVERIGELQGKIDKSQDKVARRQYEMARDALQAQLGYLRDISRSRERVVARVHNYLAALERLHLAVLNHRGADTAKFSAGLSPLIDEISNIGQEMDFASEAISEVAEVEYERSKPEDEEPSAAAAAAEPVAAAEPAVQAAAEPNALVPPELEGPQQPAKVAAAAEEPAEDPEAALARSAFE